MYLFKKVSDFKITCGITCFFICKSMYIQHFSDESDKSDLCVFRVYPTSAWILRLEIYVEVATYDSGICTCKYGRAK